MSSEFVDRIDAIVEAIGTYFKVGSQDEFLQLLVSGQGIDATKMNTSDFRLKNKESWQKMAKVFRNNAIGGSTVLEAFKFFEKITDGAKEGDPEHTVYKFVGEPTKGMDKSNPSVSDISVAYAVAGASKSGQTVNKTFSKPTPENPNLSAVCIYPVTMSPSTHQSGAAALFLNCLTSVELSRAVPYIDIQVMSPVSARTAKDKRVQGFGIYQFLLGGKKVGDGTVNAKLADALPSSLYTETHGEDFDIEKLKKQKGSFGGMESFLAPQTLVNADEYHQPHNDSMGRSASVIDRFRPLMTLESFSIETTNTRGLMAYKTGELEFTLHDRSRLSEAAAFVKPDLFSGTHFRITYGWSHPDGASAGNAFDKAGKFTGNSSTSMIGILIDSMKVTEKFKITNSSFTFDDVGQVKIKLNIAMFGAEALDNAKISDGVGVTQAIKAVKDITDSIAVKLRQLRKASTAMGSKDTQPDFSALTVSSDTTRAMSIDSETRKKVRKFLTTTRHQQDNNIQDIRRSLVKLYGTNANGKTGLVKSARLAIAAQVSAKVTSIWNAKKSGADPFARAGGFTGKGGSTKYVNIKSDDQNYVSLGLLLMSFVGLPLADTGKFEEVQFVFHSFNDRAGYVRDANIAEFPINKANFEREFKKLTKTSANVSLGKFIGFLNQNFVGSQKADVYGMKSLYRTKNNKYELKTKVILDDADFQRVEGEIIGGKIPTNLQENATALANEKRKRLVDCYGEDADQTFKFPRIRMVIEAVPIANKKFHGKRGPGVATVLRIKLYDARATPYSCLSEIITKSRDGGMALITKSGREAIRSDKKLREDKAKQGALLEALKSPPGATGRGKVTAVPVPSAPKSNNTGSSQQFGKYLKAAVQSGLLEPIDPGKADSAGVNPAGFPMGTKFRIKGGFSKVKEFVSDTMPSLHYGTATSGITSADVSSMQAGRLMTINIVDSAIGDGQTAQGARDEGLPLQVAPVDLGLEIIGCPVVNFGQHFFVDFGTGTTVDNVYIVTGISHDLSPGKFSTKLKLKFDSSFGQYANMMNVVQEALAQIEKE